MQPKSYPKKIQTKDDFVPKVRKRSRSLHTSLNERIDYDTAQIDTGTKMGIIKNPFSDKICIPGSDVKNVEAYFSFIHNHIIDLLNRIYLCYGRGNVYILGCIAWLSDPSIVNALCNAAGVQILINDEDFTEWGNGKMAENRYDALPKISIPYDILFSKCDNTLLQCVDPGKSNGGVGGNTNSNNSSANRAERQANYYAAIRTVGSRAIETMNPNTVNETNGVIDLTEENPKKKPKSSIFQKGPILHSKYIIPCVWNGPGTKFKPIGVLTGSMNYTDKAKLNQENVVWIESEKLGIGYLHDYVRSFLVSLPIRK